MKLARPAAALAALIVCAAVPILAGRRPHDAGARLAFVSQRSQAHNFEVFAVNADGSRLTQLTYAETWAEMLQRRYPKVARMIMRQPPRFRSRIRDLAPDWSPDGQELVFASNRQGNSEIFSVQADGSGLTALTHSGHYNFSPLWSPDGQWIAFLSGHTNSRHVMLMRPDGNGLTQLTTLPGNYFGLSWSPDSRWLATQANIDGDWDIYLVSITGGMKPLTTDPGQDTTPAWSPDGRWIAFTSDRSGDSDIFMVPAFGAPDSVALNLTHSGRYDGEPAWSPDGQRLAFISHRDGNREIYLMNRDGSNPVNLTQNPIYDTNPAWSPDGQWIAFISYRNSNPEVYVMAATPASPAVDVSASKAYDGMPAWRP